MSLSPTTPQHTGDSPLSPHGTDPASGEGVEDSPRRPQTRSITRALALAKRNVSPSWSSSQPRSPSPSLDEQMVRSMYMDDDTGFDAERAYLDADDTSKEEFIEMSRQLHYLPRGYAQLLAGIDALFGTATPPVEHALPDAQVGVEDADGDKSTELAMLAKQLVTSLEENMGRWRRGSTSGPYEIAQLLQEKVDTTSKAGKIVKFLVIATEVKYLSQMRTMAASIHPLAMTLDELLEAEVEWDDEPEDDGMVGDEADEDDEEGEDEGDEHSDQDDGNDADQED